LKALSDSPTIRVGMLILGVDTAERFGGVALFQESAVSEERMMEKPLEHAERLIPLIDEVVDASGRNRSEIERIAVNLGPGSFTGLRIGLASAMGLCQALNVPLVGVGGCEAYRRRAEEARRVCVLIRSRRDLVYAQWFAGSKPRERIQLLHEAELVDRLRGDARELTLVGSAAEVIYEQVSDHPSLRLGEEEARRPSALAVARLGAVSEAADQLSEIRPIYVEPILS